MKYNDDAFVLNNEIVEKMAKEYNHTIKRAKVSSLSLNNFVKIANFELQSSLKDIDESFSYINHSLLYLYQVAKNAKIREEIISLQKINDLHMEKLKILFSEFATLSVNDDELLQQKKNYYFHLKQCINESVKITKHLFKLKNYESNPKIIEVLDDLCLERMDFIAKINEFIYDNN